MASERSSPSGHLLEAQPQEQGINPLRGKGREPTFPENWLSSGLFIELLFYFHILQRRKGRLQEAKTPARFRVNKQETQVHWKPFLPDPQAGYLSSVKCCLHASGQKSAGWGKAGWSWDEAFQTLGIERKPTCPQFSCRLDCSPSAFLAMAF